DALAVGPPPLDLVDDFLHGFSLCRMPAFDPGEDSTEGPEACHVVAREEPVDVRKGGTHAACERLVERVPFQWVDPDDGERLPGEPRHLEGDRLRIAS